MNAGYWYMNGARFGMDIDWLGRHTVTATHHWDTSMVCHAISRAGHRCLMLLLPAPISICGYLLCTCAALLCTAQVIC
jgi:hypothetical protein